VRLLSERLRKLDSQITLGAYCWGPHTLKDHLTAQVWPDWVERGYLDLVNISGYYHHEKYGDRYLALFVQRMRESIGINARLSHPARMTFALGLKTSHGSVRSVADIADYLDAARRLEMDGVAFFSWGDLDGWLAELEPTRVIPRFLRTANSNSAATSE
jgi:uncharacterized lipoprotein YddW (UPF0748 family)